MGWPEAFFYSVCVICLAAVSSIYVVGKLDLLDTKLRLARRDDA
jgi:hypothetical protein